MRWLVALAVSVSPAWADDVAQAQACLETGQPCFPLLLDECLSGLDNSAVIPAQCWERERDAWQVVLDQAYSKVLLETFSAPKPVTQLIRSEQEAWALFRDLRCEVQSKSNPTTNGSLKAGCLAQMTYDRLGDVLALIGATWLP